MSSTAPLQPAAAKPLQTAGASLVLQRKCACGGSASALTGECEECRKKKIVGLQTKLRINEPGDIYEQEADRVAEQVLAKPAHPDVSGAPPRIQRFSGPSSGQIGVAPPSVDRALASPGRPLEPPLRHDMEQRFGHDFSKVRVHLGEDSERSTQDVNARAYTVGHDVVFGARQFAPETLKGRRLIAHELTHVVQQRSSPLSLQRKDAGDEFVPCGPVGWPWTYFGDIGGGPYVDQGIAIPYDKIVSFPDWEGEDFDLAESRRTFKTPSRLEQVYYDAHRPLSQFVHRPRAVLWLCNVVEPVARELGRELAGDLHTIGCLTIYNCGVHWDKQFRDFSEQTVSGRRIRGLILKGFLDEGFELDLDLRLINSAQLLLGGLSVAKAGLGVTPKPTLPPTRVEPPNIEPPPKVEPPKVETRKVETPKVETPKVETPKVETPKVETPKVETPKVETPKVETPKVETPNVKAPKGEHSASRESRAQLEQAQEVALKQAEAAEAKLKSDSAKRIEALNQEFAANKRKIDDLRKEIKTWQEASKVIRQEANSARDYKRATPKGQELVNRLTTAAEKKEIARALKRGKTDAEVQEKVLMQKAYEADAITQKFESDLEGPSARNAAIEMQVKKLKGIIAIPERAGGSHKQISAHTQKGVSESHHLVPVESYEDRIPLTKNEGPALYMSEDDHQRTESHGGGKDAIKFRQELSELVEQGKFYEALKKGIDDVRRKFPDGRYETGLLQAEQYAKQLDPSKLKPTKVPKKHGRGE